MNDPSFGDASASGTSSLARTPLHALHVELGAKFVPFAGYEMPVQYAAGLRAEHLHTRAKAGFFDVSHMGQLRIRGEALDDELERILPVDFDDWEVGRQKYSLLLNDAGGIEDDLMIVNRGDVVAAIVNASNKARDVAILRERCPSLDVEVLDAALVALQGPAAEAVLASIDPHVRSMTFMDAATLHLDGTPCFATRSGYTGEDGFEISIPAHDAERIARRLLAHPDVAPVGLGARDTLRLEAGLPLHGADIDATTTICEANLAWAVPASRRAGGAKPGGFPGAEVFERERLGGVRRTLVGLVGATNVPVRHGAQIVDADGTPVGTVTSGTVAPSLGRPAMLAYLSTAANRDHPLFALVRGQRVQLERVRLPFVAKRYKRAPESSNGAGAART